ncbi:hypothetical protein [Aureibacillus halotolerans]|uniref:hypothetical protein n=1 Tax=Aureibacillus halotolerans TaxID=1508390 RepID=UPI001414FCED|nr:hypothetical protein [Aureibacillus halotolerans]
MIHFKSNGADVQSQNRLGDPQAIGFLPKIKGNGEDLQSREALGVDAASSAV